MSGRLPRGAATVWCVLRTAAGSAIEKRAPEAAASVGFYAVFSFFPILLIVVAVGGALLADTHTQEQVLSSILRFLPVSRGLISANMNAVLNARGAVGVIGMAGLLWSATSAFAVLVRNLNRAWPDAAPRGVIRSRLMALALLACLTGLAVVYLAARASTALAGNWSWFSRLVTAVEQALPLAWPGMLIATIFLSLLLLYRLVPAFRVRWPDAAIGAAAATAAFTAATAGFTWYLDSGFARYNIVYGSLGTLVALLAWIYLAALVALLGAHLSAAVDSVRRRRSAIE